MIAILASWLQAMLPCGYARALENVQHSTGAQSILGVLGRKSEKVSERRVKPCG